MGQFIHVTLACEMVRGGREASIRTLPQRRVGWMKTNVVVWDVVFGLNPGAA